MGNWICRPGHSEEYFQQQTENELLWEQTRKPEESQDK